MSQEPIGERLVSPRSGGFFDDLANEKRYSITARAKPEDQLSRIDYLALCEERVFPGFATIPPEYQANHPRNRFFAEVTRAHGLTGLSILNERVRQRLALAMAKCIETNEEFAVIISDTDQLKHLNDVIGRSMGDLGIKANAAEMIRQLIGAGLGDDTYVFAAGESPDEVLIFVRQLDENKVGKLREAIKQRNETRHVLNDLPIEKAESSFATAIGVLSGSSGVCLSTDQLAQAEIDRFRRLIVEERSADRPVTPAYVLFRTMRVEADEAAHEVKEKRERDTFPNPDDFSQLGTDEAQSALTIGFGGRRISSRQLSAIVALIAGNAIANTERLTSEQLATAKEQLRQSIDDFLQG